MQTIVSIFLDLKLVNMQNTRSVAFMQREITSEFYLWKENFFMISFKWAKWILLQKFRSIFLKKITKNGFFWKILKSDFLIK